MLKILTAAALTALALTPSARAEDTSIRAGQRLAEDRCGACHAVDAAGASPDRHAPPLRALGARFPFDGLQTALAQGMIVGHPIMPVVHLTPTESGDLVAYLKTLQPDAAPRRSGPSRRRLD